MASFSINNKNNMPEDYINKVKFHSKLPEGSILIYGVSKGNDRQSGNNFQALVDWIIENKSKVSEFKVVLSDWLHRFYVGEQEALLWGKKWVEDNAEALNKLNRANIAYQLINWKTVTETEAYKKTKLDVNDLYHKDTGFVAIVEGLANSHKHKAGFTAAVDYLLEESAAIASLGQGVLTYPSHELNGAIHYTLDKLNSGPMIYIGHMLIPPKFRYSPQKNLFQSMFKTMCALDQAGHKSTQAKLNFFMQAIKAHEIAKNDASLFSKELATLQECCFDGVSFHQSSIVKDVVTSDDNKLTNSTLKRCSI
ncbi:hypothetical protein [Rickettsiella endosymbiont of Dermanyssus gallinae]|uniref:hypothetical protein n=1 Tax=Rickettsiella endosymbiont of Dermanyssus gallinae TaxID=2856608 RepID=UPI001C52C231|nr:hypothetical protein [Rickettsiella endosymbiont of Dermanyssus gallinae]